MENWVCMYVSVCYLVFHALYYKDQQTSNYNNDNNNNNNINKNISKNTATL